MQLDRTEIAIRQRSTLELLDLSLLVLKRHWRKLAISSSLLGLPLLLLDSLLCFWMLGEDATWVFETTDAPLLYMQGKHASHLVVLYFLQFPLISLPTSILLGSLVFHESLSIRGLLGRMRPIAIRCLFVLGIVRFGLIALVLEIFVRREVTFDWFYESILLLIIPVWAIVIRGIAPFAGEILGLELCPLRSKDPDKVSYKKRSRRLHGLLLGEHIGRLVSSGIVAVLLLFSLLATQVWLAEISLGSFGWASWCNYILLPLTLWALGLYFAVFRFLAYLDSRIRLEGWEIELRIRAEAARMQEKQHIQSGQTDVTATETATNQQQVPS